MPGGFTSLENVAGRGGGGLLAACKNNKSALERSNNLKRDEAALLMHLFDLNLTP